MPLEYVQPLKRAMRYLLGDSPDGFEDLVRHGPGATAEKAYADDKWLVMRQLPLRAKKLFATVDPLTRVPLTTADHPARVIVVEKDYRGGRVICAEPTGLQFLQQGLGRLMKAKLIARGAKLASRDDHLVLMKERFEDCATIDMKDASDGVTCDLIAQILPLQWANTLLRARSEAYLWKGKVYRSAIAASMGNGFCFDLLTACIAAACIVVTGDWKFRNFSVFGDDIIILDRYVDRLLYLLTALGFTPNFGKSFGTNHRFRESCGTDLWRGNDGRLHDVRPTFLKVDLSKEKLTVKDVIKATTFAHMVHERMPDVSRTLRKIVCSSGFGYSLGLSEYPLPGTWPSDSTTHLRWNRNLFRLEGLQYNTVDPRRETDLDVPGSWMKTTFGSDVSIEILARSGHPQARYCPV